MTVHPIAGPPTPGGPATPLSTFEHDVLRHAAQGHTYRRIAHTLDTSDRAVRDAARRAAAKLHARNMTHAVHLAHCCGLLTATSDDTDQAERDPLRLVEGLVADGFTLEVIADRMGTHVPSVSHMVTHRRVSDAMARRVERAVVGLWGLDPLECGVQERGVVRSRNRARREGWKPIPVDVVEALRAEHRDAA